MMSASRMRHRFRSRNVAFALSLCACSTLWAQVPAVLSLDSASGLPGGVVNLNLNLLSTGDFPPAGLQWTFSYLPADVSLSVADGPVLLSAGKSLSCNTINGSTTCLAIGLNANSLSTGAIAVVTARISSATSGSVIPVSVGNSLGVTGDGVATAVRAFGGGIALTNPSSSSITSLNPASVHAGDSAFTLTVSGIGFVSSSVVSWNGASRSTSFVSPTQLNAAISAPDISTAGVAMVSVSNPGGPGSAPIFVSITGVPTAPPGPSPGSVEPVAGSGFGQSVTFTFNDSHGWSELDVVNILINSALDGRQACYLAYSVPTNTLYLENDAGTALLPGLVLNRAGSLGNGQCAVAGATSAVTANENTLALSLDLRFTGSFAGNKVVYLAARDRNAGNSGWQALGTWNVPGAAVPGPMVSGVTPSRSLGSFQIFTFSFSDAKGYQDLGTVNILINDSLNGNKACYLAYSRTDGILYLMNDSGTVLLPGIALNGMGTVANNQCSVTATRSAESGGTKLALTLNLTFSASFAGNRVIYLAARDTSDTASSGWQPVGTWTFQ